MDFASFDTMTIGGLTLYEIVWFFLIYSFIGWVLEVIYNAAAEGHVINRGFLNGPVCPIYGFGMVGLLILIGTLFPQGAEHVNAVLLFLIGLVLATALELFGGWILDKLFHARWWDYSNKPFNLNGYICPEFSIYWGLGAVFVLRIFHPFIADVTVKIWPKEIGWPVAIILCVIYLADTIVTTMIVVGLNKELAELDDLRTEMRKVSDELSNVLGTQSIKTFQRMEEGRVQAELMRDSIQDQVGSVIEEKRAELQAKKEEILKEQEELYHRLLSGKVFGPRRLFKAFPDMKIPDHKELLEDIKARIRKA